MIFFRRTRENDYAGITFDLKSDLSSLFNWNTKQLYISVTAEYKTEANVRFFIRYHYKIYGYT